MIERIPARSILLINSTGQVVHSAGGFGDVDLVALGSLVAGNIAASQEIAHHSGEDHDYQLVLREGTHVNTFITDAGKHLSVMVIVDVKVPLGWARFNIRQAAQEIDNILRNSDEPKLDLSGEINKTDFASQVNNDLDRIWQ